MRFGLPDPVLLAPAREQTPGTSMSHGSATESVMMQIPGIGAFVRALFPIRLTHGHTITFGLWLTVDPADLQPIFQVWWEPAYRDLYVTGWLANPIPT